MSDKQYNNNNSGVLFVNDKQGNEKRPDWRGSIEVAGVQYWISGWERQSRDGADLISLRVEPKQASQVRGGAANPPAQTAATGKDDFDDDIPFMWAFALPIAGLLWALISSSPAVA